jgi:hypothetical protein
MRVFIFILSITLLSISACKKRNKDGEDELIVPKTYTLKGRAYNSSGLITNNALQFKIERKKPTISGKIDQVHLGAVKADSSGYFEFTYTEQENALNNPNLFHITIGLGEFSVVSNIPVHQDIEEEFSSINNIDIIISFVNNEPENKNDTLRFSFYNKEVFLSDSVLAGDFPTQHVFNIQNRGMPLLFVTRKGENRFNNKVKMSNGSVLFGESKYDFYVSDSALNNYRLRTKMYRTVYW